MKIAINKCYDGFDLSDKAHERLIELGVPYFESYDKLSNDYEGLYIVNNGDGYFSNFLDYENRTNNFLIQVVEELGSEASGGFGNIKVIEIPDNIDWEISDYGGLEKIHEKH